MGSGLVVRLFRTAIGLLSRSVAGSHLNCGASGEALAYWYLRERGFTMVARNYRRAGVGGEVDLIGWEGDTLVFVEVKTRQSSAVRHAEDAVDWEKRRHLAAAARDYRMRAQARGPYRFDVVSVYPQPEGAAVVEHFRDAFTEAQLGCHSQPGSF